MKKPFFNPPVQFETRPDLPEDLEEATRMINDLMDNVESAQLQASQLQSVHDQGSILRLNRLLQAQINFHKRPKKT